MKSKYYIAVAIVMIATAFSACYTGKSEIVSLEELSQNKSNNHSNYLEDESSAQSDVIMKKQETSENDAKSLSKYDESKSTNNDEMIENSGKSATNSKQKIVVYICGAVNYPDVYELDSGSRLIDVVNLAGGFSAEAGESYVNLAAHITDGARIYIPTNEEAIEKGIELFTQTGINDDLSGSNSLSSGDDSQSGATGSASNSSSNPGNKVNINQATAEQLTSIPGIGQSKADKIIAYRQDNGSFEKIEDIMFIPGIKDGLFNKIKDYITVE